MNIKSFFTPEDGQKARVALFLSGAGSNARKLLELTSSGNYSYEIVVLVTDAPETSAARDLSAKYDVPLVESDIRRFYAENGEDDIKLTSDTRRELRNRWSDGLWRKVSVYKPDFGVLAGFVPLSNIVDHMPCLNVHPGDLTVEEDGVRVFAGLHIKPVENAILRGMKSLRSSVILAQSYTGNGKKEMDGGPVLGISGQIEIDLKGFSAAELQAVADKRTAPGTEDELRKLALEHIEKMKTDGDHTVLPQCVEHFARGDFGSDGSGSLYFRSNGEFLRVKTVEFDISGKVVPQLRSAAAVVRRVRGSRIFRFLKKLYTTIVRDRGTPEYIARGWALGVAVGCIVPVFCQLIVAVPLSFVFRGSKIGAAGGTFVTTPPTAIFIYPIQCYIGNLVLGGNLSFQQIGEALRDMLKESNFASFAAMGRELIMAFFAGGLLWALFMTPVAYFLIKHIVIRYRKFREKRMKQKAQAASEKVLK